MMSVFLPRLIHFISVISLGLLHMTASPDIASAEFKTKAEFAILVDADTGAVLFEKDADERMAPASMSKLMTLEVVFDALRSGKLTFEDEFFISENAWRTGGGVSGTTSMFVRVNSQVKLYDLVQGIIVQSGNDACIAIAEQMAGSEDSFAQLMTKRARAIGLTQSTFGNSTGLPHPDQLMTVREIAKLALHLIETYPDYYKYFAQKKYNYQKYKFFNRNPLVYLNIGIDGLKTGYTKASGYGLVASGVQRGRRLILVVNGLKSKKERKQEARRLFEWGIKAFKEFRLFDEGEVVGDARVWGGDKFFVPLTGDGPVRILLPRYSTKKQKLNAELVYNSPLKAPIAKGDQVAHLRIRTSESATSDIPLYAAEDVHQAGVARRGIDSLLYMTLGWIF